MSARFEKLAVQRCEEPSFNICRTLELVTFVRPDVEGFLSKVGRIGFTSGETQSKSIKIAIVKVH